MAMGRPPLFENDEDLQDRIDDYFNNTKKPTLSGLAVSLDMTRQSLYNYEKKEDFFYIIKKGCERVRAIYEERLIYNQNQAGVIFALKNMGWADNSKSEIVIKKQTKIFTKDTPLGELQLSDN